MAELTPLMKQYYDIKNENKDVIVFFRLGDFYEMFDEDAKTAAPIMGVALTARAGNTMCGVPYHSAAGYIHKLIKAGRKVAICEQTITPEEAKRQKLKIVERKIVRVITPGTVIEDNMLDSLSGNYLACIFTDKNGWALSVIDVSTGEFWVTQKKDDVSLSSLAAALASVSPSEILSDRESFNKINEKINLPSSVPVSFVSQNAPFDIPPSWPEEKKWETRPLALSAAKALALYVNANGESFKNLFSPVFKEMSDYLQLDENAVRTLELVSSQDGGKKDTLWNLLDYTVTPMGSRRLKNWILNPLLDKQRILFRQSCVEAFFNNTAPAGSLRGILENISDIERIMSRVSTGTAGPRDMAGIKKSLSSWRELKNWTIEHKDLIPAETKTLETLFDEIQDISALLESSVEDAPPLKISDGGVIKEGYNAELDGLRGLKKGSDGALSAMCENERARTGINTLKIGFNSVFGYYIEISKGQVSKAPYDYTRRQTLANAERFITPALKELEDKILNAEDKINRLESFLFDEIRKRVAARAEILKAFSSAVARLDVYLSLALAAEKHNFVKPVISDSGTVKALNARHPLVEAALPAGSFVPNNINLGGETQIEIITGPNMGGKSVYLKQTALLVIMAQMGSFVAAERAETGIVDKIMTRIGAQDAMSRGESTFMVEMKETAHILAEATARSLVLLDEVGRGTSTFDGISIAWAIAEFLYSAKEGPKVLFATHYFELTDLVNKYPKMKNYHVDAEEYKDAHGHTKLAFLYKIKSGPADKSYGIHVAELAGLPASSIVRARKVLKDLESKKTTSISKKEENMTPDIFSSPIVEEIKLVNTDNMTPMAALQLITEWKKRIAE